MSINRNIGTFACILCGSDDATAWLSDAHWTHLRCSHCGLVSLTPLPSQGALNTYYNTNYKVPFDAYARGIKRNSPRVLHRLARSFPLKGRLLEVGCSYGLFLDAAASDGWQACGVELDDSAAEYARSNLGLRVLSGTLQSVSSNLEPPYDVIVAFHVIEHLQDPLGFLRHCRKLLRDGGLIFLKTPNVDSWIAAKTGRHWQWISAPAHLYLFSPHALEFALTSTGFHVDGISSRRGDAHNNLFELACAMARYAKSNSSKKANKRQLRHGWADTWQVRVASAITEVFYWPFGLSIDPWLAHRALQPELVAIARS